MSRLLAPLAMFWLERFTRDGLRETGGQAPGPDRFRREETLGGGGREPVPWYVAN
jgi:hypothetical protein